MASTTTFWTRNTVYEGPTPLLAQATLETEEYAGRKVLFTPLLGKALAALEKQPGFREFTYCTLRTREHPMGNASIAYAATITVKFTSFNVGELSEEYEYMKEAAVSQWRLTIETVYSIKAERWEASIPWRQKRHYRTKISSLTSLPKIIAARFPSLPAQFVSQAMHDTFLSCHHSTASSVHSDAESTIPSDLLASALDAWGREMSLGDWRNALSAEDQKLLEATDVNKKLDEMRNGFASYARVVIRPGREGCLVMVIVRGPRRVSLYGYREVPQVLQTNLTILQVARETEYIETIGYKDGGNNLSRFPYQIYHVYMDNPALDTEALKAAATQVLIDGALT